jgi:hypothetical protein
VIRNPASQQKPDPTWPQVDFELGVIRVITKGGVPRIIPLSVPGLTFRATFGLTRL